MKVNKNLGAYIVALELVRDDWKENDRENFEEAKHCILDALEDGEFLVNTFGAAETEEEDRQLDDFVCEVYDKVATMIEEEINL